MQRVTLGLVALSDPGDSGPVWTMLAREGRHVGRSGRVVVLTAADIRGLASDGAARLAARDWPIGAPVTVEHGARNGATDPESAKALGYIVQVEVRDGAEGAELWGCVDWTDEGRRRVRAREFQAMSIEGALGDSPVFAGSTLTNQPAVNRLLPVAASDGGAVQDPKDVTIAALTERLTAAETRAAELDAQLGAYRHREAVAFADAMVQEGRVADSETGRKAAIALRDSLGEDDARKALPAPPKAVSLSDRFPTKRLGVSGVSGGGKVGASVEDRLAAGEDVSIEDLKAARAAQLALIAQGG